MLINLSNHPSALWSEGQMQAVVKLFGGVQDLPFPQIDPKADVQHIMMLAKEYLPKIETVIKPGLKTDAVHVMGEMNFSFALIYVLRLKGYRCVASTTERQVLEEKDGRKTTLFQFVQFRDYV